MPLLHPLNCNWPFQTKSFKVYLKALSQLVTHRIHDWGSVPPAFPALSNPSSHSPGLLASVHIETSPLLYVTTSKPITMMTPFGHMSPVLTMIQFS